MPRGKKTPPKAQMKRAGTMTVTSTEGSDFLENEGHKSHDLDEVETRSKKRTHDVVDDLLGSDAKKTTEMTDEDLEKYKKSVEMAFRLFDTNKDGKIDSKELGAVLRSLGKKATAAKIQKILKDAGKEKSGSLNATEFVDYVIQKKKLKSKKEEKESESPQKKQKKTAPKKETPKKEEPKKKETPKKETPKKEAPKKKTPPKGKKEEKKEEEKKEEKEEEEKKEEEPTSTGRATLARGLSITDFFTPFAGLHDEIQTHEVDEHHNPKGRNFDLGHEKAFNIFSIILFNPRQEQDATKYSDPKKLWDQALPALQGKGFNVFVAKSENEFLDEIDKYDEAWFISAQTDPKDPKRFTEVLKKYHESGRGLMVLADNKPFYCHANLFLQSVLGIKLEGNTPGGKILKVGEGGKSGQFARHLLTTGIVNLHEGITICYPDKVTDKMKVIATSTNNHPCMFYVDPAPKCGPIVVDCGYTKLYSEQWAETAGTERYVRNCAVWLLGLDYRVKINAPWKGPIDAEPPKESHEQMEV